jgi:polysaccharide deacetylase 2 family uncharacterized protein YibQ
MTPRPVPDYEQKQYTSAHEEQPVVKQSPLKAPRGSVAIVVDDMGSSMKEVQELVAIKLPLTFAIIPGLARSRSVAEYAHAQGREVMLHIPMEPQGYPAQRVESNALLLSTSAEEIDSRLQGFFRDIPYVVGANNHMGSRFTENEEQMARVLAVMKEKGVFFLDSKTSARSVGQKVAARMGVKTASRNIFLDNVQDVAAIRKELNAAARMAGKRGAVIAICHPHPETIQALREAMPQLSRDGTVFVNVRELVR